MSRSLRDWLPHFLCLAALVLQGIVAWSGHRTTEDLRLQSERGEARARIDALHILTNRGEPAPDEYGEDLVHSLLAEKDVLLREYAFTNDICKLAPPVLQFQYLERARAPVLTPHWWICFALHRRKVGGEVVGSVSRFSHDELTWTLEALAGRPLKARDTLYTIRDPRDPLTLAP